MFFLARWHGWLLAALWLLLQLVCWHYYHGPRLYGDGMAYVAYAREVLHTGQLPGGHYARYAGYPLFLSAFLGTGLGLAGAALGQTALAGAATWAFYRTARRLAGGSWQLAAGATLLLLLWVEVQAFNAFILTESLFTSLLVLVAWAGARAGRSVGRWALAGVLLLALAAVRPNGFIGLAGAVAAALTFVWRRGSSWRWLALGAALALLPLGWLALNRWLATFGLLETYQLGDIISGYPAGRVLAPAGLWLPPAAASPLARVGSFAAHNPAYFAELAGRKLLYWLGWPKPWYSTLHRAWLVLVLPATYLLAGRGLARRNSWLGVYLGTAIGLQALIVALTLEDWEARFSGPLVPYWLLLAVLGAAGRR